MSDRYYVLTERRANGNTWVVDRLYDYKKHLIPNINLANDICALLNSDQLTWEGILAFVHKATDPMALMATAIDRLTSIVETLTENQEKLIMELQATKSQVVNLELIVKGPVDGIKAKAMNSIIEKIMFNEKMDEYNKTHKPRYEL